MSAAGTAGAGDLRAFGAAVRKEWRILRRYPVTFATKVFWPVVLPMVYLYQARGYAGGDQRALGAFADRAGTVQIAAFLYIGWAVFMWLTIVLWGPGTSLREEQMRGSLESLFLTPAARWVLLFGPAPAHLLVAFWMFCVVGVTLWLGFGVVIGLGAALHALLVIVVSVPVLFGIGALLATAVMRFQDVSGLMQALRGLFTLLCGVTFPVAVLPAWAREVGEALPPTHVIGGLRSALLAGAGVAELRGTLLVLGLLGVGLVIAALAAFRASERAVLRTGRLGGF
jgi:ABC-2 type transport system permease protein